MAPEIDGLCYISSDKPLEIGKVYDAVIVGANGYDLVAEVR